jgi:anti-sigma B factor antagonist
MEIKISKERGVCLISARGEFDAATTPEFREKLEGLITDGKPKVIIDLNEVGFIDSSGLATLVHAFKHARATGGTLALAGLKPAVRKVFELTRLDKAFDIYCDCSEALTHMGG